MNYFDFELLRAKKQGERMGWMGWMRWINQTMNIVSNLFLNLCYGRSPTNYVLCHHDCYSSQVDFKLLYRG